MQALSSRQILYAGNKPWDTRNTVEYNNVESFS
jgi:hypothetical protein